MDRAARDLERDALVGGPDDRVNALRARLRAGTLKQNMLELAAHADDETARALYDPSSIVAGQRVEIRHDLESWLRELRRWPPEAIVLAAVTAGRLLYSVTGQLEHPILQRWRCFGSEHRHDGSGWCYYAGSEPCGASEWDPCLCVARIQEVGAALPADDARTLLPRIKAHVAAWALRA